MSGFGIDVNAIRAIAVNAVAARGLLGVDALDLGVGDRFHVAAPEHRRADADRDLRRDIRRRLDRRHRAGGEAFANRVAERQPGLIRERLALVIDDDHLLDEARTAQTFLVTRGARAANEQRTEAIGGTKRQTEQRVAVVESGDIVGRQAIDRNVDGIDHRARWPGSSAQPARASEAPR